MKSPKIAVIGGGPAGSLFALYLQKFAQNGEKHYDITIYQENDFNQLGLSGCKGCSGIISKFFIDSLQGDLGLSIPENIIQSRLDSYTIHSPYSLISISNPDKGHQLLSVFRGSGPRISNLNDNPSLDNWLLRQAVAGGARLEMQRVTRLSVKPVPQITIDRQKVNYDLIVLASGVNKKALVIRGVPYIRGRVQTMAQDELYVGTQSERLANSAHVFLIPKSGLVFGTLIPKGPFINVSLLSSGKHPVSVADFLNQELVAKMLPERYERTCGCRPKTVISPAVNIYSDGFVAIGDAAVSRLYQDGIGSSLSSAREAARTVNEHGYTREEFKRYYEPLCRRIDNDNRWGRLLFRLNDKAKASRAFLETQRLLVGDEQFNTSAPQPFTRAAWGLFSGAYDYRQIVNMAFNPLSVFRLSMRFVQESVSGLFERGPAIQRELNTGTKRILILGSGFGGAYLLRHLVPKLDKNENITITMVSKENYFLFSPLLHEVATGAIETRHITYAIRKINWRDRLTFVQSEVEKIDLRNHHVFTRKSRLDYDYLIISLGSVTDMSQLISSENSGVFTLKTLRDAMLLRNHIISVFEQANGIQDHEEQKQLLTFVVAGAGYVGIQLITQVNDFVKKHLVKYYKDIDPADIKLVLVETEPKIVAGLHTRLGAYVMKKLDKMNIDVRLKSKVTHVWDDRIEINNSEIVPTKTFIWTTGVVASPSVAEMDVEKDERGRILVNEYMEVPGYPGVYAIGDCARYEDPRTGLAAPPRAHIAVRQARAVARILLAEIRGRKKKPYYYDNNAEVVSLGETSAIFRFFGLRLYGLPARIIWNTAYSLLVAGSYNQIRILTDWLLSALFGRDTSYLEH